VREVRGWERRERRGPGEGEGREKRRCRRWRLKETGEYKETLMIQIVAVVYFHCVKLSMYPL
jgi:hypothetical protein